MKRTMMGSLAVTIVILCCISAAGASPKQVGTDPVPVITDIKTVSIASFDPASDVYRYDYTVTSGPENKGDIESLVFDDTAPAGYVAPRSSASYTVWRGGQGIVPFDQARTSASYTPGHFPGTLVELGIQSPPGWMGSVTVNGEVGPFYLGGDGSHILSPGTSLNFVITSPNQPVIKDLEITPDWILSVDGEADEEEQDEAAEVEQELLIKKPVLAPGSEWPGSREHWEHFKNDIDKAHSLGWIMDQALADSLQLQLSAARRVFDTQGGAAAVPALRSLLAAIDASTTSQRNDTAFALLELNTRALITHAADTPASKPSGQFTPRLSLTPEKQSPALGSTATVTAQIVDKGNSDAPIVGYPLELRVVSGVDAGQVVKGVTDAAGKLTITLTSNKPGGESVELRDRDNLLFAQINWGGGAHLVVEYFFPPAIRWDGKRTISVQERTGNWGDEPAEPSVTRYYVSKTWNFDPATARAVGEREVPALQPHENSTNEMQLTLPSDLAPGDYVLIACADANRAIVTTVNFRCSVQNQHPAMMAAPATH